MSKSTETTTTALKEPGSPGDEFEPTAEMMVNDFDDERTLDEEEAMEEADEQQKELSNLEKEKDMPIEALLAMYGYGDSGDGEKGEKKEPESEKPTTSTTDIVPPDSPNPANETKESEINKEEVETLPEIKDKEDVVEEPEENEAKEPVPVVESKEPADIVEQDNDAEDKEMEEAPSMLHELYKDDPAVAAASRHLRSGSRQQSEEEEDEEEDGDYSPEEEDWKKTIMVGSDYQASVPDGLCKYDDAMPYENEDKLLWDPSTLPEEEVARYLADIQGMANPAGNEFDIIPKGSHDRDDEQALYLLLQCGHNPDEALRRQKMSPNNSAEPMSLWSEEECRQFETGLRQYGKDFHTIQQNRVRTRQVSELVQFYYLWKKTERHDVFANKARLEKKKYTLHPGTTDFMERFLDEQDSPVSSPSVHSLLAGDHKRSTRTPPPNSSEVPDVVSSDDAKLITNRLNNFAMHLDRESYQTLCKLAAKHANGTPFPGTSDSLTVSVQRNSSTFAPAETFVSHSSNAHSFAQ